MWAGKRARGKVASRQSIKLPGEQTGRWEAGKQTDRKIGRCEGQAGR